METVPGTYLNEFQVFIWKSSKYLLERVPGIYWKDFQWSNRNSSSYLLETVPGTYLKEFQVFIWKFQIPTGKSSRYALEGGACGSNNSVGCGGNRTSVTLPVAAVKYQNCPQTFMPLACIITACHVNMLSFVNVAALYAVLCLLLDLAEIPYNISAYNCVDLWRVSWKSAYGRPYFFYGRKWNSIYLYR
jgi:hypothetical protein